MSSTMQEAYRDVRSASSDRGSRSGLVTVLALSLITTQLVFRAWAVYGGWFFGDDIVFLSDVARGHVDADWILQKYDVQFMPVGLLLAAVVGSAGPFAWGIAATELMVFQALASLGCWWMLRTIFGNRAFILVPLTFYLFSAVSMPAIMWWAAGLNMITVQAAIFASITLHVLYLRTRRKRFAVLASLALIFGLMCYVKALLIPLVLVTLALAYFATGRPLARIVEVARHFWFAWVLYAAIAGAYLGLYLAHGSGNGTAEGNVDHTRLFNDTVLGNLGTGLVGGPWQWVWLGAGVGPRLMADPAPAAVFLAWLFVVGVLAYAALRNRGAWKPLLFLLPLVIATYGIIANGRAGAFGAGVSMEIRYWTDTLPFLALAIGLMFVPVLGATDPLEQRDPPLLNISTPVWVTPALVVAFLISSLQSSIAYVKPWHDGFDTQRFIAQARSDLKEERAVVEIADEPAPEGVANAFSFPYNRPSYFLAPVDNEFTTPRVATDIKTFDDFGRLAQGKVVGGITVNPEAFSDCIGGNRSATIDIGTKTFDYPFWLSLTYRAEGSGRLALEAGDNLRDTPIEAGSHTLFVRTEGVYDTINLQASNGLSFCIEAIQIGPGIEAQP